MKRKSVQQLTNSFPLLYSSTGTLTVSILPAEAMTGGAKWNADFGSWQDSGAMVSNLAEGSHTVSFSSLVG